MAKPTVQSVQAQINTHEAVCAERWAETIARIKRIELLIITSAGGSIALLLSLVLTQARKMLGELAAANAAFAIIKQAVQNGRELADAGAAITKYVGAKEELSRRAKKKKRRGVQNTDLEEFMALEKLKQQEDQLRETMIWSGRPGLWAAWQAFQAQARKSRRVQEQLARKRRAEFVRAFMIFFGIVVGIVGGVGLIIWALFLRALQ